jgi:hypothetical protein
MEHAISSITHSFIFNLQYFFLSSTPLASHPTSLLVIMYNDNNHYVFVGAT